MKKVILSLIAGAIIGAGGFFAYSTLSGCACCKDCNCTTCERCKK